MRPSKEKRPPDGDPGAHKHADIVSLPVARNANKTARTRFLRLFPERMHFVLESLDERDVVALLRLLVAYVKADGELQASDRKLAVITKAGRRWPELRDTLIELGLGRIEGGYWIDDDQDASLDIQRRLSARGLKGSTARWHRESGGSDAS